ncbi:hypothetical protein ACJJTC_012706 [Scirpophaga incertulas]
MDSLKRKRTQQRREFTTAADSFEAAIKSKDIDALEDAYSLISEIADNLQGTESTIRDIWCECETFDEILFQADQDRALEYRKRWLRLQNMYNKVTKPSVDNSATVEQTEICGILPKVSPSVIEQLRLKSIRLHD